MERKAPEDSASLNPDASDFTPKTVPEEVKSSLNTEAASFEPVIESYVTQAVNHVKQVQKFEGRYGLINFVNGENLASYDANEDTWTTHSEWTAKSKVPEGKYSKAVMTGSSSFVITGGFSVTALKHSHHIEIRKDFGDSINSVSVYEMNEARYLHSSVFFNSSVFVIGGQNSAKNYLSHVEAFENGVWVVKPPLYKPRSQALAFCNNSAIWVAGGFSGSCELVQSIEKFSNGNWTLLEVSQPMLAGMFSVPRDKFNSSFLILGGSDGNNVTDRVLIFNTETSTLELESFKLIHPRAGASTCWFGSNFWVVGGGQTIGEVWNSGNGKETRSMPLTIYSQIESASFMRARD